MYTTTHRSETTTDKTNGRIELPTDATLLGTDGKRATHYYSRSRNRVIVIDTADLVTRYDLRHRSLLTWVTYIALADGWHELTNPNWFVERLAEAVVDRAC